MIMTMNNLIMPTGNGVQLEKTLNTDYSQIKDQIEASKLSAASAELEANKG